MNIIKTIPEQMNDLGIISPVVLPNTALFPSGNYANTQISNTTLFLYQTMQSNGRSELFTNPVSGDIQNLNIILANTELQFANLAAANTITSDEYANVSNMLTSVKYSNDLLQQHTDRISGITDSTDTNPDFHRIVSAGLHLNNVMNQVNGAVGCVNMLGAMTGLFSSEILNDAMRQINGVMIQFLAGLKTVLEVVAILANIKNIIINIINSDIAYFNKMLQNLLNYSLAGLLESIFANPCAQFLLSNVVGTQTLKSTLSDTKSGINSLQIPNFPSDKFSTPSIIPI